MFGVEVKPKGKRTFKRLSVSMANPQAMKREAAAHVIQHCKDFGIDLASTEWRVINRDTDGIIALGKQIVIH